MTTLLVFTAPPTEVEMETNDLLRDHVGPGTYYVAHPVDVSAQVVVSAGPVFDTPQEVSVSLDDVPAGRDLSQYLTGAVAPVSYAIIENDEPDYVFLLEGTSVLAVTGGAYEANVTVRATDANGDTADLELMVIVTTDVIVFQPNVFEPGVFV